VSRKEKRVWVEILITIVPIIVSIAALTVSISSCSISRNQEKNNARQLSINAKQLKDNEASSELVVSYKQKAENGKEVTVVDGNHSSNKVLFYPVQVIVHSGAIVQIYPIVSSFSENDSPKLNIGPDKTPRKQIKSMTDDKIELFPNKVTSFTNNMSFYQSYLLVGSDNSYHLVMLWCNEKQQGFLDEERALSSVSETEPAEIRYQYQKLKEYLIINKFEIK